MHLINCFKYSQNLYEFENIIFHTEKLFQYELEFPIFSDKIYLMIKLITLLSAKQMQVKQISFQVCYNK